MLPVPDPIIFDENILTDPAFLYKARASFMQTPRQDYFYSIPSKGRWAQDRQLFFYFLLFSLFKQWHQSGQFLLKRSREFLLFLKEIDSFIINRWWLFYFS